MKSTNKRIQLDWGRLLGFEQVKSAQCDPSSRAAKILIGAKIGGKAGVKGGGGAGGGDSGGVVVFG